jgi:hypothetical protein
MGVWKGGMEGGDGRCQVSDTRRDGMEQVDADGVADGNDFTIKRGYER